MSSASQSPPGYLEIRRVKALKRKRSVSPQSSNDVPVAKFGDSTIKAGTAAAAILPADYAHTRKLSARDFRIKPRASGPELSAALNALLDPALFPPTSAVSVGRAVETRGQFEGHCAFVSLLRASSAALSAADELQCVVSLRRIAVFRNARRLILEPDMKAMMAASAEAAGCIPSTQGRKAAGSMKAAAVHPISTPTGGVGKEEALCVSYLTGQLAADGKAATASRYAGPLELAALSEALVCTIVVLIENDNREDIGGQWAPQGSNSQRGAPPLVIACTRRQHMFPVNILPRPPAAQVWTIEMLNAIAAREKGRFKDCCTSGMNVKLHTVLLDALDR